MRRVSFEEYDKKRKLLKIDILNIRDNIERKTSGKLRKRDDDKMLLLYKLAKNKRENTFRKLGRRQYELVY